MGTVKIKIQNVNGLVDSHKRNQVFYNFKQSEYQIFLIQEAHCSVDSEKNWKSEWGGDILFSHGTRESGGTCILFKNNVNKIIHNIITDENGRYVIVDIELDDLHLTLASLYAPNEDNPQFFVDFISKVESMGNDNRILGGDWNLVMDIGKDKRGGLMRTNFNAQNIVKSWMQDTDLCDIFRHIHPDLSHYTWKRLNPPPGIFCRLDFFLISFGLIDKVYKSEIMPGFKSDHSAPILYLGTLVNPRGPGYWKLNCSHLSDPDFITEIKKTILNTVEINSEADPQLLWDTIKCNIRGTAVQFSSKKKKSKENLLALLENRINILEKKLSINYNLASQQRLDEIRGEYDKIVEEQAIGAQVRSRIQWYEEGERPTKYFLNLEQRNGNNKNISRLILYNGTEITNSSEILTAQQDFYEKLYTSEIYDCHEAFEDFISDLDIPKLSDNQKTQLEGPITEAELLNSLRSTSNGKSPGIDGLPADFYKVFWNDIKDYLIPAFTAAFETGRLSWSQRQGFICLIPKKDKNILFLKNWRPLSLLNADYKILSKTIANRFKTALSSLIHTDQTGFIKGRYIGENITRILDIIEYTDAEDIPALLISVDFEKAYDCVEWTFLFKVLKLFNFGENLSKWVKTIINDSSSCVGNNGWMSQFFKLSRGMRQGCPLSPYLFTLCVEILGISIRGNEKIKGIEINGNSSKISQFADDATLTVLFCQETLDTIIATLDKFYLISGLKVNYDKTEVLRIGSMKNSLAKLYTQKPLRWTQDPMTILGIKIVTDDSLISINFEPLIQKVKTLMFFWQQRDLTWYGKITIIKSLLASQFVYRMLVLPTPDTEIMKVIEKLFYDFFVESRQTFSFKGCCYWAYVTWGIKHVRL